MKLLTTLSECSWITEGVVKTSPDTKSTVAHCIPSIFPSYAKIFHPIYEDLSVQDEKLSWQEDDKDKGPKPKPETETQRLIVEVLSQASLVYGAARPGSRPVRIRWAELAKRFGMPFVPTLSSWSFTRQFPGRRWPRHLIGPVEGNLIGPERDALAAVLRRHAATHRNLFRFWFLATTDWGDDKVFEGTLDEVGLFPDEVAGSTPHAHPLVSGRPQLARLHRLRSDVHLGRWV